VSVALGTHHAMRMRHDVACGLPALLSHTLPHYLNRTIFGGKKSLKIKYFGFLYNFCLKHFSFQEELREI